MRYESPLEHGAFRQEQNDNDTTEDDFQTRAITIRAGAGLGISRAIPEGVSC